MGILGGIANISGQILAKIIEVIIFLILTVVFFLETAISFPLFTDEDSFRVKNTRLEDSSNLNSIKAFSICFFISVFLIFIGDILFNLMLAFSEFSGVFAHDIANARVNIPSIEESHQNTTSSPFEGNNVSNFVGEVVLSFGGIFLWILQVIVELLDLVVKIVLIIVFICIIVELLFLVIAVLLYALDLYILLRKNIYKLPDSETMQHFEVDSKDSLILNFIAGLLVLPIASTLVVSVFLFFVGTLYEMILAMWVLPSGSRVAIPLMNQILQLITCFFSIDYMTGQATRMLIGLFWMLIGLSSFRYRPQQGSLVEMKSVSSNYPVSIVEVYRSDEVFVKNYALSFLLLFDPIISLSLIYYLGYVVIPF